MLHQAAFRCKSDDLLRCIAKRACAAAVILMSMGIDDGAHRLIGLLRDHGFHFCGADIRIQRIHQNDRGIALDDDTVAVSQADDALDTLIDPVPLVRKSLLGILFQ